jgi:hypothetical protein
MKRIITAIIILWSIQNVNGQKAKFSPYVGIIRKSENFVKSDIRYILRGDIGMLYGKDIEFDLRHGNGTVGYSGIKIGSEFNVGPDNFVIGPKIGYELDLLFFGGSINFVDYTDFKTQDFRFMPEVGFSILGRVNLFYSYSIPLGENKISGVGSNRLGLTVNFTGWKQID